ncbi:hypothetical protein M2271_005401 [Streptomyces sp. LBL]|uniref:hypothetical protein n=1 Tax=Streptomyces sp. LBL TaxID=2940562 RepID=UPI00247332F1|nr:hypothetical protein [Streptomyces sp. LBL]MDH6627575.1 hypothetical protein [Streptomyces sp. LBL]
MNPRQAGRLSRLELHCQGAEFGDQGQPRAQRRLGGVRLLQVELDAENHIVRGEPHQWVAYPFFETLA